MTVFDNVAFGPRSQEASTRPRPRSGSRDARGRPPRRLRRPQARQLSGGQQQRVALARALVNYPSALLLDEPLGALDLKLRQAMQLELKRIQREVGITFIYVTHDQEEALTMSDRIAVMSEGRVEQIGTPDGDLRRARHGVRGRVHRPAPTCGPRRSTQRCRRARRVTALRAPRVRAGGARPLAGDPVTLMVRPERHRGRPTTEPSTPAGVRHGHRPRVPGPGGAAASRAGDGYGDRRPHRPRRRAAAAAPRRRGLGQRGTSTPARVPTAGPTSAPTDDELDDRELNDLSNHCESNAWPVQQDRSRAP